MGHAGYARPGKPDILCASISTLVINTINSLEELAGETLQVSSHNKIRGGVDHVKYEPSILRS